MVNVEARRLRRLACRIVVAGSSALTILGAGLTASPRLAAALPTYSEKEHKPCGYCHVNPAGDGVRNAVGKEYEANGHTFKR